jgi:hypothetical protein
MSYLKIPFHFTAILTDDAAVFFTSLDISPLFKKYHDLIQGICSVRVIGFKITEVD